MKGLRGSFLGFTFNNIHSSVVGITRTSHGNFNEERLVPIMKDLTMENPGSDSTYHFETLHQKREFVVKFCFEAMTEQQLRQISLFWNDNGVHELIFDEYPYKVYLARITGNSSFKQLCFNDRDERYYAGEGSFIFTCAFPYARSRFPYREDYVTDRIHSWVSAQDEEVLINDANVAAGIGIASGTISYDLLSLEPRWGEGEESNTLNSSIQMSDEDFEEWLYSLDITENGSNWTEEEAEVGFGTFVTGLQESSFNNKEEWIESSELPSNLEYGSYSNLTYKLYNAGDIPMPFRVWFRAPNQGEIIEKLVMECGNQKMVCGPINYGVSALSGMEDYYIVIDTEKTTIEGFTTTGIQTGNVFNKNIQEGDLFLLPLGEQFLKVYGESNGQQIAPLKIEFHYLYY
jgi:hypothetical protein